MSKKTKKQKAVKQVNPALAKEAAALDQQLRQQWGAFKLARRAFGEICLRIKAKKLHRFIENPKSHKPYISMWEYVRRATGGEISRSSMFDSMKIAKLTKGPHAIPARVVDAMPIGNAAKLTKVAAHKRLQLVKKAVKESPAKFSQTAAKAEGKRPIVVFSRKLHPIVATMLTKAIASFVNGKGEGELTKEETAVVRLCKAAEFGRKALAEQAKLQAAVKVSEKKLEDAKKSA